MAQPILISDLRGGRNGVDPPTSPIFPANQCTEAQNIDFSDGPLGGTRGGSENVSILGGTAFTLGIRKLCRHVPSGDEADAELWGIDGAGLVKRMRNGTAWADVTLDDAITGSFDQVSAVSFNGKLFLFYKSAQNRCHVFDPELGRVRRVGLAAPTAAPSVINSGVAGAYPATQVYYRTRNVQMSADLTRVIRKSEASPSVAFTPSGANNGVTITQPARVNEGETHWEVEVSLDNSNFYQMFGIDRGLVAASGGIIPIATLAVTEGVATTTFASLLPVSDPSGMYTLFPAAKFAISDNNRIIMAGSFVPTSEPNESRIWLSPVLGSDDRGDDERWVNQSDLQLRIDTSEKNGGSITSILGPVSGIFWTMKYRQVWRHTPTGILETPYLTKQVSTVIGAITHSATVLAEDVLGSPAGYFLSTRGYYRLGVDGFLYLGRDVEDIWKGKRAYAGQKINLSASIVAHAMFHVDECELYLWLATGTNDTPNIRLRCNLKQAIKQDKYGLRGGWVVDTGAAASAYCSAPFANTPGVSMSKDLKPYIGRSDTTVYKCDSDTVNTDNGTTFRSFVRTKSIVPPEVMGAVFEVTETILTAEASPATIKQVLIGDFRNRKGATTSLDAREDELTVIRKFGASMTSEQSAIQVELGDLTEIDSHWVLHSLTVPVGRQGSR